MMCRQNKGHVTRLKTLCNYLKQLTSYDLHMIRTLRVSKVFPLKILELRTVLSPVEESGCSIALSCYDVAVSLFSSTQRTELHAGLMRC